MGGGGEKDRYVPDSILDTVFRVLTKSKREKRARQEVAAELQGSTNAAQVLDFLRDFPAGGDGPLSNATTASALAELENLPGPASELAPSTPAGVPAHRCAS